MYIWNKFLKRWEPGSFCVTRTGWLMRFERPLTELDDGNLTPSDSINLTKSILGDLSAERGEASFSLVYDKYVFENTSHGTKRLVQTPIKLAKDALSRLRTSKFCVPIEHAQQWYDAIAAFAQKERVPALRRKKRQALREPFPPKVSQLTALAITSNSSGKGKGKGHGNGDGDEDADEVTEDANSSTSSIHYITETCDMFDANDDPPQSIAARQPGHITHNPW